MKGRDGNRRWATARPRPPATLAEVLDRARKFYAQAGAHLQGQLVCNACGYREACTAEQAGRYLAKGWPRHCGRTLELVTKQPRQLGLFGHVARPSAPGSRIPRGNR